MVAAPEPAPIACLLGGLAMITILVISATLILACSIWKRNGERRSGGGDRDLEQGGESVKVFRDKVLVIMAGDENPTFLATPAIMVCPDDYKDDGLEEKSEKKEAVKEASSSTTDQN